MSPYEGQGSAKGLKARDSILFYQDRGTVPRHPQSPGWRQHKKKRSKQGSRSTHAGAAAGSSSWISACKGAPPMWNTIRPTTGKNRSWKFSKQDEELNVASVPRTERSVSPLQGRAAHLTLQAWEPSAWILKTSSVHTHQSLRWVNSPLDGQGGYV